MPSFTYSVLLNRFTATAKVNRPSAVRTASCNDRALAALDEDERRQLVELLNRASGRFAAGGGWVAAKA
jgi:hypothetical protein